MRRRIPTGSGYISTGSTLLNLLITDDIHYGIPLRKITNICGGSFAGKTFLLWTIYAEATHDKLYDDYDIYYDEPEEGFTIDTTALFGSITTKRVITSGNGFENSATIEGFGRSLMSIAKKGKPFIYGLDSFDTLYSEVEKEKGDEDPGYRAARRVRILNETFRHMIPKIKSLDSALIIVSQVRDNMKQVGFGPTKTRSGGNALKHWSAVEMWLDAIKRLKKDVADKKKFDIGADVRVKVTKNRETGMLGAVDFPLTSNYGIDDITSTINFMCDYKFWKKSGQTVRTTQFGSQTKKKLITMLETNRLKQNMLMDEVQEAWTTIRKKIKETDRVRKYK